MDLKALLHAGIASRKPIAREFEFEGEQITAFFVDLPAGEVRDLIAKEDRPGLVAATVCDAEGNLVFTEEQAKGLRLSALTTLVNEAVVAVGAAREGKEAAKKPSEPTPG